MQLLTRDIQESCIIELAVPILKTKDEQHSLVEKILSKIRCLPDYEQSSLLALVAPKLEGDELKRAFNMLLALKANLARTLALIDFLFFLKDEFDVREALREILQFIANTGDVEDKRLAIEAFITKLKSEKAKVETFESFSLESAIKDLVIRVSGCDFELKDKISLIGMLFDLSGKDKSHQLIAMQEYYKDELVKSINGIKDPKEKYLALLRMLENFPLEEKELNLLISLALNSLKESSANSIRFKDKVSLLAFLPTRNLKNVTSYYGRSNKLNLSPEEIRLDVCGVDFFDCESEQDYRYFEVVEFLMEQASFNYWVKDSLAIIEKIKSPVTKADAIILVLSKLDRLYRIQEKVLRSLAKIS